MEFSTNSLRGFEGGLQGDYSSRGHFLCWRGFRGGRLWLATPVAVATQGDNMLCYALFCREKKPY